MTTHAIETLRTARYVTLGGEGDVREVWLACHGYGQSIPRWARHFEPLAHPARLVIVPEALSRFYLDDRYQRVGASWMTRENRDAEITDQTRYLDAVVREAAERAEVDLSAVGLVGFGFSQGTATICRWLERSLLAASRETRADRLLLWGGRLPHDLDLMKHSDWLRRAEVVLIAGDRDPIATPARVMAQEQALREAAIPFRTMSYEGQHRLNAKVLASLGDEA
ncbi:MAG: esterase [Bacteroidota bacterium]